MNEMSATSEVAAGAYLTKTATGAQYATPKADGKLLRKLLLQVRLQTCS
jgi:hypothetical protein